jgi:hypothetical protein
MMRFNAVVIASILLLGGIAGCNQEESNEAVVSTPQVVPKRPQKRRLLPPSPQRQQVQQLVLALVPLLAQKQGRQP